MLTLKDLVQNGTMNAGMAELLKTAVNQEVSFLTVALPRNAGKSTLTAAIFKEKDPNVQLHYTSGEKLEIEKLRKEKTGGYLVVAEFSKYPNPGYIWNEPARRVFKALDLGYSLQSCIHATSPQDAIKIIAKEIKVDDTYLSHIKLVLYIEMFEQAGKIERRLVEIYEVFKVENGKPSGQTLFKWDETSDAFKKVNNPKFILKQKG